MKQTLKTERLFATSTIKTMRTPVTDTGTGTRKGTRTRTKAVTKTRTKKRTISLLWKSVLLRHELNRVKAAGHAEEATFAAGRSALQAVTAMSRLFNTASAVVQVRVLGCSASTWQQWAVLHETKWVRRQYGRFRFGVDCNEQLMRGSIEGDDGESTGGGGGDLHG